MTYSSFQAAVAILLSMAVLGFQHYAPWRAWLGADLSRPQAYTLGVLAIILPQFGLWATWAQQPPAGNPFWWCISSLAASVIMSGVTVYGLYLVDQAYEAKMSARMARLAEAIWREGEQYEPDETLR